MNVTLDTTCALAFSFENSDTHQVLKLLLYILVSPGINKPMTIGRNIQYAI